MYFGLNARRRMDLFGATQEDFARVKVKNSRHAVHNELARFTKEYDIEDVMNSPVVSDPLRLLDICCDLRRRRCPRGLLDGVRQGPRPRRSRANRGLSTVTPVIPTP